MSHKGLNRLGIRVSRHTRFWGRRKKFKKHLTLHNKQFVKPQQNTNSNKKHLYIDKTQTINLIETKKNYIIPLQLYSNFIQKSYQFNAWDTKKASF